MRPSSLKIASTPHAEGAAAHAAILDALVDDLPSGVVVIDRDFLIRRVNRYLVTWLGRTPEEMVGNHCYRLIHAREAPCPDCPCAITFQTSAPATATHAGLDARGNTVHAELISLPIRDASGQVVMALESVRDVTERERHLKELSETVRRLEDSEQELRRRNEELEILNALLGGTSCTMGLDAVLARLLAGALRLVGGAASGAILLVDESGRRLRRAVSSWIEEAFVPCETSVRLGECSCGAAALSGEVVLSTSAVRARPASCPGAAPCATVAVPLHASEGILGALVVHLPAGRAPEQGRERLFELMGREIGMAIENARLYERTDAQLQRKLTELTGVLQALEQERARALASERAKAEFVTMLSHDLRAPLSVIYTDAGELSRVSPEAACRSAAASIRQSVRRAAAMLDDVVDSARLESGALDLRRDRFDLVELVSELVNRGFPAPEARRLQMSTELPSAPVLGDRSWLERAAANVIGNALKFAPVDTPVLVRVAGDGLAARVEVIDQGPGIPADELPLVFKRFFRASNASRTGGSGLGLHIVRLVVDAHGGQVFVRSEVGRGTTIAFTLPLAPTDGS
jgi:PAS domain S-box-containing protein